MGFLERKVSRRKAMQDAAGLTIAAAAGALPTVPEDTDAMKQAKELMEKVKTRPGSFEPWIVVATAPVFGTAAWWRPDNDA